MKIKVMQKDFYDAIQKVHKAVSNKTSLPILNGILLKTVNNQLRLVGTDLEIGIESFLDVEVIEEGEVVLPADYLNNILRELTNQMIQLDVDDSYNTLLKTDSSKFNIHGSATEEYPSLPEVKSEDSFTIEQTKLKEMIEQIKFSISKDDNKPFLTGGLMVLSDNQIELVATDTYRLAYRKDRVNGRGMEDIEIIIPNQTLNELNRLMDDTEEVVEMKFSESQILFKFNELSLVSRLIEGQFPKYQQVIPKSNNSKVVVNKDDLLRASKRAALFAKENSNIIKINLTSDRLIITSNAPDVGQAYEEIQVSLQGKKTEIAFNANYLIECLKSLDVEEINLELSDSLSPGLIRINKADNVEYIYVIMPVRSA